MSVEFELTHCDVTVQHINYFTMGISLTDFVLVQILISITLHIWDATLNFGEFEHKKGKKNFFPLLLNIIWFQLHHHQSCDSSN